MSDWIAIADELEAENDHYAVDVPTGVCGKYAVCKFTLSKGDFAIANLRYIRDGVPEACVSPGNYTSLVGPEGTIMTNTQLEYRTSKPFVESAEGHVLISGLGLGMLIRPLIKQKKVLSVTVLEKAKEVIKLVAPTYKDLKDLELLRIIQADTFEWKPDRKFDCAFHDIWHDYGSNLLPDYRRLKARYRKYVGRQECWPEQIARRMARLERRYG